MQFQKIGVEDLDHLNQILQTQKYRSSDYTLYILFEWKDYYKTEICYVENGIIIKNVIDGEVAYTLPINVEDKSKYLLKGNYFICGDEYNYLKEKYNVSGEALRNSFDYMYEIDQLAYLKGKRNNKLRNHVNKYNSLYGEISEISEITQNDADDIINFLNEYQDEENMGSTYLSDLDQVRDFFKNYEMFAKYFHSYKLKVNGKIIGIVSGEIIDDTVYMHILKCFKEYSGVYHFLNNQFCAKMFEKYPNLKYVNREDDVGDEGLRTSKLQYHPIGFIEKYSVKML